MSATVACPTTRRPVGFWDSTILPFAASIVREYETGVTLRQLFYRLVAAEVLRNTKSEYNQLSTRTAEARRRGEFPRLIDRTRIIHRNTTFVSPDQARRWLGNIYMRDRTEDQAVTLYIGIEKAGIVEQLSSWFGDELGIPILAFSGYSSETYLGDIGADTDVHGRPAVLLYAGDFDPSGEDILRDIQARCPVFDEVRRIALTPEQVEEYELPPQLGKSSDTRSPNFVRRHGRLVQVELDALPASVLRRLYADAIAEYWDTELYEASLRREEDERELLVVGGHGNAAS